MESGADGRPASNAMFSIMDFMPTFTQIIGAKMPADRPIDGVDQTDVLCLSVRCGDNERACHQG
jgi:hypothetical protein